MAWLQRSPLEYFNILTLSIKKLDEKRIKMRRLTLYLYIIFSFYAFVIPLVILIFRPNSFFYKTPGALFILSYILHGINLLAARCTWNNHPSVFRTRGLI